MDITSRDSHFEKSDKHFKLMKEAYLKKLSGKTTVLKEAVEPEVAPIEPEPVSDTPVDGAVDTPIDSEIPPTDSTEAPLSTTAGTALTDNPELVLKTQAFADATVAKAFETLGGFSPETDILPSGVLKKEISDPQLGNYTILVYPSELKAVDVAVTAYPEATGAENEIAQADAENPEGAEGAVPETTPEVAPEGSEVPTTPEEEPLKEEKSEEQRLDESRDPTMVGKKDWAVQLRKLLKESVIKEEEKKEVSLADRLKTLQEKLKTATGEEKEAVEDAIEGLKSRIAKAKNSEVVKKDQEKHKVSDHKGEDEE